MAGRGKLTSRNRARQTARLVLRQATNAELSIGILREFGIFNVIK
jgi:hypothetical protein